jgi:hypothetical protein
MTMMPTPTLSMVMKGGITISNDDDVDADSERGGEGGDHHQQWR